MAQHDLDIANQSAPNFRQDLNNALESLVTLSSGTTEPDDGAAPYANQLWYDSANNILKIRNEANDDWINLFTITQSTGTSYPSEVPRVIDQDNFSNNDSTRPPSQQSTKAYVDAGDENQLGVGQTWQDVSGSRANGVSYQNTTGKPIFISVQFQSSSDGIEVSSNNSTWVRVTITGSGGADNTHQVIIPDTWYYRTTGGFRSIWTELR